MVGYVHVNFSGLIRDRDWWRGVPIESRTQEQTTMQSGCSVVIFEKLQKDNKAFREK